LKQDLKTAKISPEVKQKLLFNTAVTVDVTNSYADITSHKEKDKFALHLRLNFTHKYRFRGIVKSVFKHQARKKNLTESETARMKRSLEERVKNFYLDDETSTLSACKKDTITVKGDKNRKDT